jgi:beta-galactosidase
MRIETELLSGTGSRGLAAARCSYVPQGAKIDLNGAWGIAAYYSVYELPMDFLDRPSANRIPVPSCVQYFGYDSFQYTNVRYPFPYDPPYTPRANPAFHFSRDFTLTGYVPGQKVYAVFEGVDSCFYLIVNRRYVGFSQVSHKVSEFDITPYLEAGVNRLDAVVVKWCAGSYIEDQDKWRFTGIFRDVYLLKRPQGHIVDYTVTTEIFPPSSGGGAVVRFAYNIGGAAAEVAFNGVTKSLTAGESVDFRVDNPKLWSDTAPYLYDLTVTAAGETVREKVGIRSVAIEDGIFKLNGRHIKLKGVNRHDFHPEKGAAVNLEDMRLDLALMKKCGINAIRTSHYPSAPAFYRLCDEAGFYVLSEADVECHGTTMISGGYDWSHAPGLTGTALYSDAILERNMDNVTANKNRPSVIIWSMGNESGLGGALTRAARAVKELDPTRPVHYEGAFCNLQNAGKGDTAVFDMVSRMYPTPEWMAEEYLKNPTEKRPLVLCEYSFAMGGGSGDLSQYWRIFNTSDRFMGGFVWEWRQHGVLTEHGGGAAARKRRGKPRYKHGGDFTVGCNDGNYCINGIVGPGMEILPVTLNLSRVYGGTLHKEIKIPFVADALRGHEFAEAGGRKAGNIKSAAESVAVRDGDAGFITVICGGGRAVYAIDRATGEMVSAAFDGKELLMSPLSVNAFRAPTDNDRNVKNKWLDYGLSEIRQAAHRLEVSEDGAVTAAGVLAGESRAPCLNFTLRYGLRADGFTVGFSYSVPPLFSQMPRVGLRFALSKEFSEVVYEGYGPHESYIDTFDVLDEGTFRFRIKDAVPPYLKPQECGSRYNTKRLTLLPKAGRPGGGMLLSVAADKAFSFSALPYSAETLFKTSHNWRLPARDASYICLDAAMRGIGSNACGPELNPCYEIPAAGEIKFSILPKKL